MKSENAEVFVTFRNCIATIHRHYRQGIERNMLAFIQNLGVTELLIIGGIALLVFGNRLPSVARSMGKSLVEFKKGMNEIEEEVKNAGSVEAKAPSETQSKV
jgi:sec-independent protein translocase protein TatA